MDIPTGNQIATWWRQDGAEARRSNTYLRREHLGWSTAAAACLDDYAAGINAALAAVTRGRSVDEHALVQRYEREYHGETVDVRSFTLGVRRLCRERGLVSS